MKSHLLYIIILVFICILSASLANAQPKNTDSGYHRLKYRYTLATLLTGGGVSFNSGGKGLLQVSFPYTSTSADSMAIGHVFMSGMKAINKTAKLYYVPFGLQAGTEKHFFNFYITGFSEGVSFSAGYGRNWNLPKGEAGNEDKILTKKWLFKSSLNIFFETINFDSHRSQLGSIDNDSLTIYALGKSAGPTFRTGGGRYSGPHTDAAKNLDVIYSQSELSLVPQITVGNNPFRGGAVYVPKKKITATGRIRTKTTWELSLGYKASLLDWGGLSFKQNNGHNEGEYLGGTTRLANPNLTVLYNSHTVTKVPFRFSGLYLSFIIRRGSVSIK